MTQMPERIENLVVLTNNGRYLFKNKSDASKYKKAFEKAKPDTTLTDPRKLANGFWALDILRRKH